MAIGCLLQRDTRPFALQKAACCFMLVTSAFPVYWENFECRFYLNMKLSIPRIIADRFCAEVMHSNGNPMVNVRLSRPS